MTLSEESAGGGFMPERPSSLTATVQLLSPGLLLRTRRYFQTQTAIGTMNTGANRERYIFMLSRQSRADTVPVGNFVRLRQG
jgi:hypothetical protein